MSRMSLVSPVSRDWRYVTQVTQVTQVKLSALLRSALPAHPSERLRLPD
jgi:hypothetical protein